MADLFRTDAAPVRLVVVNLDRSWRFATLVRRYALDVFADPATRTAIRFRTLGSEDDHREARRRIWGAQRPQFYGDDLDGLLADFASDLDDFAQHRVRALAYIVVSGDPAAGDRRHGAASGEAHSLLARMEQRLHGAGLVAEDLRRVARFLCVRTRTGEPTAWPDLERLLDDPANRGRELADAAFELSPGLPTDRGETADAVTFRLLRCVMDIVSSTEATGLLQQSRAYALRPGLGRPAAFQSEGTALAIRSYVEAARRHISSNPETAEGRNPTKAAVAGVIGRIKREVRSKGAAPDTGSRSSPDRSSLDPVFERLRAAGPWWRGAGQRAVMTALATLPVSLAELWTARMREFEQNRRSTEELIATDVDPDLRAAIHLIPIVAGGLSGTDDSLTRDMRQDLAAEREAAALAANACRANLVGFLDAKKMSRGRSTATGPAGSVPLVSLEPYRRMERLSDEVVAAHRGLVPLGHGLALLALAICAFATAAVHSLRLVGDDGILSGLHASRSIYLAVMIAGGAALGGLWLAARSRRDRYLAAVDALAEAHDEAWRVVETMTVKAYEYVAVSRQAFYFDVLAAEIDRRTEENGRLALDLALEDIGMADPGDRPGEAIVDPTLEQSLSRQPVGRWVRALLDSGEILAAASGAAGRLAVEVDDGEAMQRITVPSRAFTGSQSLAARPILRPEPGRRPPRSVTAS